MHRDLSVVVVENEWNRTGSGEAKEGRGIKQPCNDRHVRQREAAHRTPIIKHSLAPAYGTHTPAASRGPKAERTESA